MLPSLHALPVGAPEYLKLDELSSAKLEEHLTEHELRSVRCTNHSGSKDLLTFSLNVWKIDDEAMGLGPGQWNEYTWTVSLTGGRDPSGTRRQYVGVASANAICGDDGHMSIPLDGDLKFAEQGDPVDLHDNTGGELFAGGEIKSLRIPEWNMYTGTDNQYEIKMMSQNIRSKSDIYTTEQDGKVFRHFNIRIRFEIGNPDPEMHSTGPQTYISVAFRCTFDQPTDYEAQKHEVGIGDDWSTGVWELRGVTLYQS